MVALAANAIRASRRLGKQRTYPVTGSDIIYAGSLVMIDSAGYANPALAQVTNRGCVGVAVAQADNSSGSAGDINVTVQEGEFLFTGTTMAQSALGTLVYAEDDNTVDETQGANEPVAGVCAEFVSATSVWVAVSLANSKL